VEWIKSIVGALTEVHKVPASVVSAIALITGALLFIDERSLAVLRLNAFVAAWGAWLGLVFIISAVVLGIQVVQFGISKVRPWRARRKLEARIISAIEDLDGKERAVLREFVIQEQKTIQAPVNDPVVAGLIDKGILVTVGRFSTEGFEWPMRLSEVARPLVTPDRIGLVNLDDEGAMRRIKNQRPGWAARERY
jgi:hypothetical protein